MFKRLLHLDEELDEMEGVYEPRTTCCICTRPPIDPRALPAAEARKRYNTIIRKRTRPDDFLDSFMFWAGMLLDSVYDIFRPQ